MHTYSGYSIGHYPKIRHNYHSNSFSYARKAGVRSENDLVGAGNRLQSLHIPLANDAVQVGYFAQMVGAVNIQHVREIAFEIVTRKIPVVIMLQDVTECGAGGIRTIQLLITQIRLIKCSLQSHS